MQPQEHQPMFLTSSNVVPPQPMPGYVTVQAAGNPGLVNAYLAGQSKGLGITLIVIGVLAFVANGIGFGFDDIIAPVGHGFWSGTMFIVTGSFGIGAASKRKCLIITFMVMGIMSAVIAIPLLGNGIGGALANVGCYSYRSPYYYCNEVNRHVAIAIESILAVLAVAAAVVSIWGSAICCKAVCCCAPTDNGTAVATSFENPLVFAQYPGTVQYGNPVNDQAMNLPMSPPEYRMYQAPVGHPATQQQFMVSGQYPPQYGYSMAVAPPSVFGPTSSGVSIPVMSAMPAQAVSNDQKTCVP